MTDRLRERAEQRVAATSDEVVALSHRIHGEPELAFGEHRAAAWIADQLDDAGLDVSVGAWGLPTAIDAQIGDGALTAVLCAEYDALPEIGHACGHNIIAASSVGAALALAPLTDDLGIRLRLVGTPAEEGGGGKIILLERGAFDGAHLAAMVHPGPVDLPFMPCLATTALDVTYEGVAAHASAFPERGVNAADAVTVAQVAIGLLRQHLEPDDRVHGIVTHGGTAANVVPAAASLEYMVRAGDSQRLGRLESRVRECFRAGATATGADLQIERSLPIYEELVPDPELTATYRANAERRGRTVRDVTERARRAAGSTDMGNVSRTVPSIHPMLGIDSRPAVPHQPEFARAAASPAADTALLDAAVVLAWTVIDAATTPDIRERLLGREAPGP